MSVLRTCRPPLLAIALLVTAACTPLQRDDAPPVPPPQAYPALFEAVQQAALFEDQKQFVDMVPRSEDWQHGSVSEQLTAAAFPLFVGIPTPERTHATADALRNQLLRPGGLVTTSLTTGQQWDAPNVWAPLQWIAIAGLRRYGEDDLAGRIARNFLTSVQVVYASEHKLMEKYNAETGQGGGGEYPLQDGFGWTNGVTLKLMSLYGGPDSR